MFQVCNKRLEGQKTLHYTFGRNM